MHPLDARPDRKEYAVEDQGLGYCNITKCCTEVCPEHIKITDNAIIPMKERVVDRRYDPVVWLGRKIFRRDHVDAQVRSYAMASAPGFSAAASVGGSGAGASGAGVSGAGVSGTGAVGRDVSPGPAR